MAFYMDEEQVWKCPTHPSKRRRNGICAKCLRDRLVTLCPDCATARPCACPPAPAESSSSGSNSGTSSSGPFSLFSFSRGGSRHDFGEHRRESTNSDTVPDPTLRKSRSVAISFLRSRSRYVGNGNGSGNGNGNGSGNGGGDGFEIERAATNNKPNLLPKVSRNKINFWSVFTVSKSKKCDVHDDLTAVEDNSMMMRSRSVAVGAGNGFAPANSKHKGWYFPSPIKAFRHSKPPRSVAVS